MGTDERVAAERRRWEEARLRLVRLDRETAAGHLAARLSRIARIASRAMQVDRVSLWALDQQNGGLRAIEVVDADSHRAGALRQIPVGDLGQYARMLHERRVVLASDVSADPATSDLAGPYFARLGIEATIDAPIYRDGEVVGVCCHEHRGGRRQWTSDEAAFAVSVAEVVALELASDDLRAAEHALRTQEQALHEALREEAIARMARGVAHDVNNLLAVALGATAVLQRMPHDDPEVQAEIEVVEAAARSASRLVHDLLEVGQELTDDGEVALDDALHDMVPAMRASIGARALALVPDAPLAIVPISRARLEQVVLNLVVNARDATQEGGHVEVRSSRPEHDRVRIEVRDDGAGLAPEVRDRMYDPYFTTKAGGHGLGLPTVLAIVRRAGGSIRAEGAPGAGTAFIIELPARAAERPSGIG
jgi:signal transduction histidine kinase